MGVAAGMKRRVEAQNLVIDPALFAPSAGAAQARITFTKAWSLVTR